MNTKILATTIAALLTAVSLHAQSDNNNNDEAGAPPPPPPGGDAMRKYHEAVLDQYDADKNGKLGDAERASLKADVDSGAFPAPPPPPAHGRGGPGHDGPPHLPPELMEKYDTNKDGELSKEECDAFKADVDSGKVQPPPHGPGEGGPGHRPPPEIMEKYDTDGDGELNETERAALKADIESGKVEIPPPPPRGDRGGPGGQRRSGPRRLPRELMEKYDTNKDGKLDDTERAALDADRDGGKLPPPPQGGRRNRN